MKKILVCLTVSMFFMMMPFVSFAKTAMSESEMRSLTAQEGITINFGAYPGTIAITNFSPSSVSWGDADGFSGYTTAGYLGVSGLTMGAASSIILFNSMTIDVGTNAGATKVNIGLPSALIHPVTTNATIRLDTTKTLGDAQPALGTLYNDNFAVMINSSLAGGSLGGSLTLSSHAASQGAEIGFNNVSLIIPPVAVILSWGDADGFSGYTTAGYLGAKGLVSDAPGMVIGLSGTMSIDVGTNAGVTGVKVVLPTATINPTNITIPLALGNIKDFTDNQKLLGSLYMVGTGAIISGSFIMTPH
jgi:hypothetical protein